MKTQHTLQDLKKLGRVTVYHTRYDKTHGINRRSELMRPKDCNQLSEKGGLTTVELEVGPKIYIASAQCSKKDNFNRKRGVQIAVNRLYSEFSEDVNYTDKGFSLKP